MTLEEELYKAVKIIPKTTFILPEFMAMLAGKKPVVVTSLQVPSNIPLINSNFPDLFIAISQGDWYLKNKICAISRNKKTAEKGVIYLDMQIPEQGRILGYPPCCVKKHDFFCSAMDTYNSSFAVYESFKNSKRQNYLLNNLFNFSSRLGKSKSNFDNKEKHEKLNRKLFPFPLHNLQYISHIPCSYNCKQSIQIGKEIEILLKKYAPDIEKKIKYTLAKPVLFFDMFNMIVFDGFCENNNLYYDKVVPPFFHLSDFLMKYVKKGNKIRVSDDEIQIFNKNKMLFTYKKNVPKDGFIINFS